MRLGWDQDWVGMRPGWGQDVAGIGSGWCWDGAGMPLGWGQDVAGMELECPWDGVGMGPNSIRNSKGKGAHASCAVCDFRLSYGRLFGRGAAIVAVNRDREQLLRNSDVFWKARLAVQGDAASFVVRLARSLPGYGCNREWLQRLRERERSKEQENREKAAIPTEQHLNPLELLQVLDELLPPESLLVADGGDFVGTAAYIVRPRRPLAWLDPGEEPSGSWDHGVGRSSELIRFHRGHLGAPSPLQPGMLHPNLLRSSHRSVPPLPCLQAELPVFHLEPITPCPVPEGRSLRVLLMWRTPELGAAPKWGLSKRSGGAGSPPWSS
uniref:Uncharacterized protein n=1 Tax=Amazona collaria TaxID=241587 RepID=A0A8B9G8A0_9PSIT